MVVIPIQKIEDGKKYEKPTADPGQSRVNPNPKTIGRSNLQVKEIFYWNGKMIAVPNIDI